MVKKMLAELFANVDVEDDDTYEQVQEKARAALMAALSDPTTRIRVRD